MAYLTIDFDLTVTNFKNTIYFEPGFCYKEQTNSECVGTLKFTTDKKIYHSHNMLGNILLSSYEKDTIHLTFVYSRGLEKDFSTGTTVPKCSPIFCYVDGTYIGEIGGYQTSRVDVIHFNGLRVGTIISGSHGTDFSVDNLEIYAYGNTYAPKNINTVLENKESLYSCEDWCYYKKENE